MCFILEAIREIPKNQISIWTRTRLGYVFGMSCVKWRQIIRKFISDLVFYIVKPNKNFRLLDNDRRNHRLYTVFSELWATVVKSTGAHFILVLSLEKHHEKSKARLWERKKGLQRGIGTLETFLGWTVFEN